MQRRRASAQYEVSTASAPGMTKLGMYGGPEALHRPRNADKANEFLDLRVDMHDRATKSSAAKSILGVTKVPLLPSKTTKPTPSGVAYQSTLALMMPGATPNGLKRCQSASTIRKKLQHAMDQSAQPYQDQVAALRALSATSIAKPTPKSLLLNHRPSAGTASSANPLAATHAGDTAYGNQHRPLGEVAAPKPKFATMFAEPAATAPASGSVKRPTSASGAYRSTTIELEVQLAERLNEIERSKLSEKAESRFRAAQRAFDHIIQQDEVFGRILASVRDEYDAYVAFLTHHNRASTAADCRCHHVQHPSNQSRETGFDAALIQQENSLLKKNCSSMQREIEVLQASILATAIQRGTAPNLSSKTHAQPEEDSVSDEEEELSDVLLLPLHDAMEQGFRPPMIPQLDLSCLSPYNEEEEEWNEADDDF